MIISTTTIARRIPPHLGVLARAIHISFPRAHVYLVGGYLRDLILKKPSKDIDLAVSGVPARKLEQFLKARGTVNLVGRTFGVFKFIPKGSREHAIDIALPRRDFAEGTGGRRDFVVQSDATLPIEEDLSRRDFTINAMAWDILQSRLIDPHHGAIDITKKIIRAVGLPEKRFAEDYSRMLRALRFACQLNFSIEQRTWKSIQKSIKNINRVRRGERIVPYEIIAKELLKAFFTDPPQALDLFDRSGALKALIPEALAMKGCPQPPQFHSEGDVWTHTRLALKTVASKKFERAFGPRTAEQVLVTLFHDIAKPKTITRPKKKGDRIRFEGHDRVGAMMTKKIAERLRLSSYKENRIDVDAERLEWLVAKHLLLVSGEVSAMRATTIERHYLRDARLGSELLALQFADGSASLTKPRGASLASYRKMRRRINELLGKQKKKLPPPLLDGNEIMNILKIKPGPTIGKIIEELREAQLQGKIKSKAQAKSFIEKL